VAQLGLHDVEVLLFLTPAIRELRQFLRVADEALAIGEETGVEPLADCSLVVAPYDVDGEAAGTIGVLGPTRMDYSQALAAVAVVSRRLGNVLSEG